MGGGATKNWSVINWESKHSPFYNNTHQKTMLYEQVEKNLNFSILKQDPTHTKG